MPVYNGEPFVREALECLTRQTFGDFELIISDNCSTDGTPAIVEEFAARDPRIRVIRQARNLGAPVNLGFVLDAATAEYFMWFSHDDWVEPNYLEAVYGALTADPQKTLAVATVIVKKGKSLTRPWEQSLREWPQEPSEARRGYFPNLSKRPRVWRVMRLLRISRSGWFYGLYRAADLRRAHARAVNDFAHVRSFHLTFLPFLLNDRVAGTNETVFYKRKYKTESQRSQKLPRPEMLGERYRFAATFFLFCLRELFDSRLTLWEKLVCVPAVLAYTSWKGEKFRPLIRSTLAWPVRRVWLLATGREL